MLRRSSILVERSSASGLTLVELLVVLAIIATLAGIVYPAIISSIQKSEAAMAAQRIDAVEKAKVQYRLLGAKNNEDERMIAETDAFVADLVETL